MFMLQKVAKCYLKHFDENLKKRFANIYKLSNHNINNIILMLQKSFYPYKHMDD